MILSNIGKGLGFITVPLFSRIMEPSDFGIYNTFLSYEGILYLFVGLALHSSIKNALYKYGTEHIDEYTSSILIIPFINAFLFFVFGNIALPAIQNVLYIDRIVASVSLLGVAIITLSNINQIWVRFLTAIIVVLFAVFYVYKKYIKK